MCGIAGIINLKGIVDPLAIKRASDLMTHRGPDEAGRYDEPGISLLHRRLSIIDIKGGSQPIYNEDRSLVIVFNGEIYNFQDLRHDLESRGHAFSTQSDTEVIVHAYEEWGEECVEKFHGMFAFAIFDRRDRSIFLSRDRCGEKPLYYLHDRGKFVFASEIHTLLAILKTQPPPDLRSVYLFLRLGYIPSPNTYYQGIHKLSPGSSLFFRNGELSCRRYYTPIAKKPMRTSLTEAELCDELDALLFRAVEKMLVSEAPLGAFLSGGIDSSLIAAMMVKAGKIPDTFSISFNHASYDESSFAKAVARHIGARHTCHTVEFGDLETNLSIMDRFGEPFADTSGIPTYHLTRETRKKVTVALSGDGADEIFGGYRRYMAQRMVGRYLCLPPVLRKRAVGGFLSLFPARDVYYADSFLKSARLFCERAESADATCGLMLNTIFSHAEITSLFPDLPDGRAFFEEALAEVDLTHGVEALITSDRLLYLPDNILVKVDRMSMQNSVEVRAPFLDPAILEFSDRIPLSMKIRGVTQKYLLKKVALRYLPPDIVFRKKQGFMVPMTRWINRTKRAEIDSRLRPLMGGRAVGALLDSHFKKGVDHSHKLFTLMILGRHLKG